MQVEWAIVKKVYASVPVYYVARIAFIDEKWFEIYKYVGGSLLGPRCKVIRNRAADLGVALHTHTFYESPDSRFSNELICSRD